MSILPMACSGGRGEDHVVMFRIQFWASMLESTRGWSHFVAVVETLMGIWRDTHCCCVGSARPVALKARAERVNVNASGVMMTSGLYYG